MRAVKRIATKQKMFLASFSVNHWMLCCEVKFSCSPAKLQLCFGLRSMVYERSQSVISENTGKLKLKVQMYTVLSKAKTCVSSPDQRLSFWRTVPTFPFQFFPSLFNISSTAFPSLWLCDFLAEIKTDQGPRVKSRKSSEV